MKKNISISKFIICLLIVQCSNNVFSVRKPERRKRTTMPTIADLLNRHDISPREAIRRQAVLSRATLLATKTKNGIDDTFCNTIEFVIQNKGKVPFEDTPFYTLYLRAKTNHYLAEMISTTFSIKVDFSQSTFFYLVKLILQGKNLPCTRNRHARALVEKLLAHSLKREIKRKKEKERELMFQRRIDQILASMSLQLPPPTPRATPTKKRAREESPQGLELEPKPKRRKLARVTV